MALNLEQLRQIDVFHWDDFSDQFRNADLLLGNGFSLQLNELFRYESLFDKFLENLSEDDADIFQRFGTTNFEMILSYLESAKKVDTIFGIEHQLIEAASGRLKEGLIKTVGQNHPRSANLNRELLTRISEQLDHFSNIFTLSYDALLYHIIMITLDRHRRDNNIRPYSDHFWGNYNDQFLKFMPTQNLAIYKRIYYLHGALFLFRLGSATVKIRRTGNTELIDLVEGEIRDGKMPLFVSEGSAEDKQLVISRSDYLHFAHAYLKLCSDHLVIYGTSLSTPDVHVIQSLKKPDRQIAVSLRIGDKSLEDLGAEIGGYRQRFPGQTIHFYDSTTIFGP